MINCNENDNDTIDHINKTQVEQDVDMETNTENVACLGQTMSVCNKTSNINEVIKTIQFFN